MNLPPASGIVPPVPASAASHLACYLLPLALLLPACQKSETAVQRANRSQTLLLGNLAEPADLDPHVITAANDFQVALALFEGLTSPDPQDLHPTPGAARSWDVSPDGTVYTFHLRPEARWSDGSPVTARDFLYSFRRILSPALGSEYSYMLFVVKNAEAFNVGKLADFSQVGFAAPDDLTLRVTLNDPTPYFLSLVGHSSWFPVQQATIERFGKMDQRGTRWTRPENFVGNGPFNLKTWQPNQLIVAEKSETYWDAAKVKLHAVHFYPIESLDTEERAFRAGQLHITNSLPPGKVDSYRQEHPELLQITPFLGVYFYRFNTLRPPLNDVRVRRALAMSLDRPGLVKTVLRAGQPPAYSLVPPGTAGYQPVRQIAEDVPAAQRLLAEAGFPGGARFPAVSILFNTNESHRAVAEAIQQMWKRNLGIDVALENQESKVQESTMREMNYTVARYAWFGDYPDPNTFLSLLLSNGGNNETGWRNAEYDNLLALAARTADPATRLKVFQQAEGILVDEVPILPIYIYTRVNLRRPEVMGWHANALDLHTFKGVYLKTDAPAKP